MSTDKGITAIIIIANGNEQHIHMDKVKSLTLTYKDKVFELEYIEETKKIIPTLALENTQAEIIPEGNKYPEERKSTEGLKRTKGYKHGPITIQDMDQKTLSTIYKEYRDAVPHMSGRIVAMKWGKELGINYKTLTVWMSQIKQILDGRPTTHASPKLYKTAEILK